MLDVKRSPELQATILSLKQAERGVRLGINKQARSQVNPLWRSAVTGRARTTLQRSVIASGMRATASDRGVSLLAATSGRPLSGGLVPSANPWGAEQGSRIRRTIASRKGITYPLWTGKQWLERSPHGVVAYDAASEVGTKIVALWVNTVVDEFRAIRTVEIVG